MSQFLDERDNDDLMLLNTQCSNFDYGEYSQRLSNSQQPSSYNHHDVVSRRKKMLKFYFLIICVF